MKRYIKITLFFIVLIIVLPTYSQNSKCSSILDNIIKAYDNSNGITANFSIYSNGNGFTSEVDGKIFLNGNMFTFTTEEMECGFDGKTLWAYIKNNNEINLSHPDEEEIANINPYLLFKNYKTRFNCSYKSKNGNFEVITLSPKNSNDNISNIEVTINNKELYPVKFEVTNSDKSKIIINVSDYNDKIDIDKSSFVFNKKRYPNIEIIDLR